MNLPVPSFQTKILRYVSDPEEYKIYLAALEWSLIDPIVIENRKDLKSEYKWRNLIEPYFHQVTNLITFCRRLPVTLLADDVGLGKTISAGLIASELMARGRVSKILIVCPKLLIDQWIEELDKKFGILAVKAIGQELITTEPPEGFGAVITTYQSARSHLQKIGNLGFQMLILDEAHKLRNLYGIDSPPQVALRFRQALADRLFKYVLMLTATPIQNRLWDMYSLVDLLTVARGHENPFGSEGLFVRNFIADNRSDARQLKADKREEFRSIVYGYMSRVRRVDANLDFPDRKVLLHKVDPSPEEIELINAIREPIQKLNRLAQISILQALISSPEALATQLNRMAENRTIPQDLAPTVHSIIKRIKMTAKLQGLKALIDNLKIEQAEKWRMVIFTGRKETQTTIQLFLESQGIACGLINGDTGARNQDTIKKFKNNPPDLHVIISTEAGSEGINLQVANILVNYDLPWNPMIVEQRIGRVQRLASEHASVCVFNITLRGTFEEYIVGRLMEKLQMAAQALGDVEALLEGSGLEENEDGSGGFEEEIRKLVINSLAGKNVEAATEKALRSITEAKLKLEQEEKNINEMLAGAPPDNQPQCPHLPETVRSMDPRTFTIKALGNLGAELEERSPNLYQSKFEGKNELIRFDNSPSDQNIFSTAYSPGTPRFEQLVSRFAGLGRHSVKDLENNVLEATERIARNWVDGFQGLWIRSRIKKVWRCFKGSALVKVRVTVAHDSYERLVSIVCTPSVHRIRNDSEGLSPASKILDNPNNIGIDLNVLAEKAMSDEGISEFCRFYTERLRYELKAAGNDPRKIKKIEDDFTPRTEIMLVGAEGETIRELEMEVTYKIDGKAEYSNSINIIPSSGQLSNLPSIFTCEKSKIQAPAECFGKCSISNLQALKHLLVESEISKREALPENSVLCGVSGKRVLFDEVDRSDVSGKFVIKDLLKTSPLTGKRAEQEFFGRCEFTGIEALQSELATSQVSAKHYRIDEQQRSAVSGKTGHKQEFITCALTQQSLLPNEAERCEITNKIVMPGILEQCSITAKKVLPEELEKSSVSGKKALKNLFVSSNISNVRLLEEEAIRSAEGKFCTPLEAKKCSWSERVCHPEDLRICQLIGLPIYFEYITMNGYSRLEPLSNLLNGLSRNVQKTEVWPAITANASLALNEKTCKVETAELSPDGNRLAVCLEVKSWMGIKIRHAGFLYSINSHTILGRIALGKILSGRNNAKGWVEESK